MTLEDKQHDVMAGSRGKDDVTRTPKQNRKRPLSAVLEEFESDSEVFEQDPPALPNHLTRGHANHEDSPDGQGMQPSTGRRSDHNTANHSSLESTERYTSSRGRSRSSNIGGRGSGGGGGVGDSLNERTSSGTRFSSSPTHSRPTSTASFAASLKAIFETGSRDPGLARSPPTEKRQQPPTSPQTPARGILAASVASKASSSRRSPSASPNIPRRRCSGLLYSSSSDVSDDDMAPPTSDMTRLRQMAERLCLSTRRASVQQWRAQYVDGGSHELPALWDCGKDDVSSNSNGGIGGGGGGGGGGVENTNGGGDGRWTAERTERINKALDWIKTELHAMRSQDQQLARQLLTIRSDLHRLKLARSCEEHRDMLDDVQLELEELQEFADVLDLPMPTLTDSPLKHLGVTRMNISARRFSTC